MQSEDQTHTQAFLTSMGEGGAARVIATHISLVYLCGARVFKLKRAVKLPYLDFSTPDLRLEACERELALNRRTAPQLYVAVRRITREHDGALAFDGDGDLVDAVVEMRCFDQNDLFDAMAQQGRLDPPLLTRLARTIAAFHGAAAQDFSRSGSQALAAALAANEGGFGEARIFGAERVAHYFNLSRARFDRFRRTLDKRGEAGFVRRGHGDLHLRNICLYDGEPMLFDCLEFDDALATTDVLYDLAFLLMDLTHRGLRREANLVFNRYVDETGDDEALGVLPFFMAVRAAVRAHVGAAGAGGDAAKIAEARDYLSLALDLLGGRERRLVAVGGLSGAGKSTVAASIAGFVGEAPGARILSSDRLRKQLAGVEPAARLPASSYTAEASNTVYAEQRRRAKRVLQGGCSVIADAVFLKPAERGAIEALAAEEDVDFLGLWLEAAPAALARRIEQRRNDPSDATADVLAFQLTLDSGPLEWRRVDASGAVEESAQQALALIGRGARQ